MRRRVLFLAWHICALTYALFYTQISLTAGSTSDTGCVGYLNPIERLQFPGMCFQDAGQGVRATDFVSAWPAGLHIGARYVARSFGGKDAPHSPCILGYLRLPSMANEADKISWNRNLSRARALGMGGEFRIKGANVFLGPVVSPLGRTVTSGRNWEGT